MDISKPPEGYEWLYTMIRRVEEMHDATVGEGSPVRLLQREVSDLKEQVVGQSKRIDKLTAEMSRLHGDYSGLHNLTMAEQKRNDENWKRVNANYELVREEVNHVKKRQDVVEQDVVEIRKRQDELEGSVESLKGRFDRLEEERKAV